MKLSASEQKGLAAIEFVILSPLLIVFIAICADIGNLLVEYQTLNKSVRNGARYAVSNIYGTATATQIAPTSEVKNVVVYGSSIGGTEPLLTGLTIDSVNIIPPDSTNTFVTVTATHTYTPIFTVIPFLEIDTNINVSASAVMEVGI